MKKKARSMDSTSSPLMVKDENGELHTVEDYTRKVRREAMEKDKDSPLLVPDVWDEEFAKLVRDGIATKEDFNSWRFSRRLPQFADVATALHDRVESRMKKGVDRTVCPEGMTDLEHNLAIAANCGASGPPVRDANRKRKDAAKTTAKAERNKPRMDALDAHRKKNPDGTLPEAAKAIFNAKTVSTEDAGKKWLGRMVKAGGIAPFAKGSPGRPLET